MSSIRPVALCCALMLLSGCGARTAVSSAPQQSVPKTPSQSAAVPVAPGTAGSSSAAQPDQEAQEALYREILLVYGATPAYDDQGAPTGELIPAKTGLFYADDWDGAETLPPLDYYAWYLTMVWKEDLPSEELAKKYAHPKGPEYGWFFPQALYEETVRIYFDVSTEHLRSDPNCYDAALQGYLVAAQGGGGMERPAISLDEARREGDLLRLSVTLAYPEQPLHKILTVRLKPEGGFLFEGWRTVAA